MRVMHFRAITTCAVVLALDAVVLPLEAQVTRADTAAVVAEVARTLEAEGRTDLVIEVLRFIIEHYPGTPAASEAERRLLSLVDIQGAASGRTEFIVWNTTYGIFLGIAVPAALGAEDPEPFGLGLLVGGPVGFFLSSAYSRNNNMSSGQAKLSSFATQWGTWQAVGWREVLNIGDKETCYNGYCEQDSPDEATWVAAVTGGLVGMGTGLLITRQYDVSAGAAEFIRHGSLWGTWYGVAIGIITDAEEENLLAMTLLGGDAGLLAGVLASRAWPLTAGQVRLMSIAGVAGLVAGVGLDLIVQPEDDGVAMLIPTVSATVGLIVAGTAMHASRSARHEATGTALTRSLVSVGDGVGFSCPTPLPVAIPSMQADGRVTWRPGLRVTLLDARF